MRSITDTSTFIAKTALTQFVLTHMPSLLGGFVLGTLFITSVGTGAGLALGISTVINRDIIKKITHKFDDEKKSECLSKMLIIAILAVGSYLSLGSLGDTILSFAFMSMGLRGATVFAPLCFLLWAPGRVSCKWALVSIIIGPFIVLLFNTVDSLNSILHGWDPLFPGIFTALLIMNIGLICQRFENKL